MQVIRKLELGFRRLERGLDRVSRNVIRLMIIGIILNIVASLYPEFSERFPIIYGWFDGWLQFGEFEVKAGLGCIYSFIISDFDM